MRVPNLFLCLYLLILAAAFAGTPPEQASTGSGAGPGAAADTGTGSQTDEDPELKKLKAASALADERLKLYNKRKELAAAQVPTIPAGNAGALTLTGDPVEGVGMAYEVLGSLTAKMAGLVRCGDENTRIIVFSATEIAGIETYHAWQAQVQLLIQGLKDAIAKDKVVVKAGFAPSTIGPGIAAIGPGITALVNLISLFRQDFEIKVTDITPDEKALVALLAGKLRDRKPECKAKVYYPAALPVGLLKTTREIDKFLADIETQREEVAALNLKRIGEKPAAEKEASDKKNEAEEFDKTMKELAARRKALEDKKAQAAKEPDPKKKEEFRKANEAEEKQLAAEEAKYTKAEFIKLYNAAVSAQEYLDRLTQLLALFDTALKAVDAFRTSLLRMDEPSGLAQITKLQRAVDPKVASRAGRSMKLHVDNQEAQKIRVVRKKGGRRWLIELPEVIVKFRPSVTAVAVAAYFKKHYDVDWEELGEPGRYLVRVKNPIETLALSNALNFTRALVEYAEPNFGYFKPTGGGPVEHPKWPPKLTAPAGVRFPDDPGFPSQWALWNRPDQALPHAKSGADIRFQPLWQQSVAGLAQVRVAVLDFAVDVEHPDLKPSIDANGIYDAVRNVRGKLSPSPPDSRPDADHGTACAGIIGAVINNQIGVSGIVQNVKLLPIQMAIIDTQTGGTVISASSIDRALTAAVSMQADVINFSWGTTAELEAEDSQAVKDAIARTAQGRGQKGILFVASAGNNAKFMGPEFPASLDADDNNVLAVGASNWCDEIKTAASCDGEQDWSSQTMLGNTILVPGVRILTTSSVRNPQDANDPRNYRANFNGSSAASPFATAVAALILSAHPELTAIQVKKRLWDTADELAPGKPYRRLNACRALGLAACAAASPTGRLVPSLPAADRV